MSETAICLSCRRPGAPYTCGLCEEPVCRGCQLVLEEDAFAFATEVAPELKHLHYCAPCFEAQVEPELAAYRETLERAKEVFFFFDSRKKPVQVLKKGKTRVVVDDCADRDETILRMGFLAAVQGFNAIVEAEVVAEKVRDHGWQKTRWRGKGWPASVDAERLERHLHQRDW